VKRDVRVSQNDSCAAVRIGVTVEAEVIVVCFGNRRRKEGRKEGKMLTSLL